METWGGLECTINRVGDSYFDQLDYSGHYDRDTDLKLFTDLGISKIRYPILWEKHRPHRTVPTDWGRTPDKLQGLVSAGIEPIAGLVHHGSGPRYVNFMDGSFEQGLADYGSETARRFPFINYYTPVNEPLTTARFCGLYGLWYPHFTDDRSFLKILLSECKAIVLAMEAIRKVNPQAKFVHTEDLGKTHSTPLLKYQADFENHRRWLASDLLCGWVDSGHTLYKYLIKHGISDSQLEFFIDKPCPPDILGFNHYLTSERYLDERMQRFPAHTHGCNDKHHYADVEVVRVGNKKAAGPYKLFKEAWGRYGLPMAITEAHLHCSREEQLRWLLTVWKTADKLRKEGVEIAAVTFWALLGSFGWNKLLVSPKGDYESGIFDIRSATPRPTILSKLVRSFSLGEQYDHPVLHDKGWWQSDKRVFYNPAKSLKTRDSVRQSPPLIIIGKTGTLGYAFGIACTSRNIHYHLLDRQDLDITNAAQVEAIIKEFKPWAIINAAGYVRVDDAEEDSELCYRANTTGPCILATLCARYGVKLTIFSSDLVFDGGREGCYLENDTVNPLNVYGDSKAKAEQKVLRIDPTALVIRTAAFFGPWDQYNFVAGVINRLKHGEEFYAEMDVSVSPTYVPDLVDNTLNLLIDDEIDIWHLSNNGVTSWADLAAEVAGRAKLNRRLIRPVTLSEMNYKALRPKNSSLESSKGIWLPSLDDALKRYFAH